MPGVSSHPCDDQGRSLPPPGLQASLSLLPRVKSELNRSPASGHHDITERKTKTPDAKCDVSSYFASGSAHRASGQLLRRAIQSSERL